MNYDVFNGDADGICALHQWRLAFPADSEKITGVKRDIHLLKQLEHVTDSIICVFDISFKTNAVSASKLLSHNNNLIYFDHHQSGDLPTHPHLQSFIDTSPHVCSSILVNRYLDGRYARWAVVAAFGDHLPVAARLLSKELGLSPEEEEAFLTLGELMNYNAYGNCLEDLTFHPAELYHLIGSYENPLDCFHDSAVVPTLKSLFQQDLASVEGQSPYYTGPGGLVYLLPPSVASQRVVGTFSNRLAAASPQKAHATLLENEDGSFLVSVRAPSNHPYHADTLCQQFATGGGRSAAGGIQQLPPQEMARFIDTFSQHYPG